MSEEAQCEHELYGERCRLVKGHSGLHDREFGLVPAERAPEPTPSGAAAEVKEAKAALERDRTRVAECVTAVKKALSNYAWLKDSRGPYEWDDNDWHKEFTSATAAIENAIEPMVRIAADWSNCPKTQEEIQAALAAQKEAPDAVWDAAVEACARIVEQVSAHNVTAKEWDEARNATQEIRALKRARPAQTEDGGKE